MTPQTTHTNHGRPYLFWWLRTNRARLESLGNGATFKELSKAGVARIEIPLPPLSEQRRIAAILNQAELVRSKRSIVVNRLDELARDVFVEFFGDPTTDSSKWPLTSLKEFFRFRTGKLDSNAAVRSGEFPFFTCAREDFRIDTFAFDCEALLLAGNNANADYSVKYYKGKFNAYQRTYVINLLDERNSYQYARFALEFKLAELKRVSKGTNTKYLTLELLNNILMPLPPIRLQNDFAKASSFIMDLRRSCSLHLEKLNLLLSSLQDRAFRGELTSRQAGRELEMAS